MLKRRKPPFSVISPTRLYMAADALKMTFEDCQQMLRFGVMASPPRHRKIFQDTVNLVDQQRARLLELESQIHKLISDAKA